MFWRSVNSKKCRASCKIDASWELSGETSTLTSGCRASSLQYLRHKYDPELKQLLLLLLLQKAHRIFTNIFRKKVRIVVGDRDQIGTVCQLLKRGTQASSQIPRKDCGITRNIACRFGLNGLRVCQRLNIAPQLALVHSCAKLELMSGVQAALHVEIHVCNYVGISVLVSACSRFQCHLFAGSFCVQPDPSPTYHLYAATLVC